MFQADLEEVSMLFWHFLTQKKKGKGGNTWDQEDQCMIFGSITHWLDPAASVSSMIQETDSIPNNDDYNSHFWAHIVLSDGKSVLTSHIHPAK